jgi:hypothetical protein
MSTMILLAVMSFASAANRYASDARPGLAQAASVAVEFSFRPRDLAATPWHIHLDSEGRGTYIAESDSSATHITVSAATLQKVLSAEPVVRGSLCGTKQKHIAFTGTKTISFKGETPSSCRFDYSDSTQLMTASSTFQALAETVQVGQRLAREERFDHLGIDADMDRLDEEAKDGRALELQNIATTLRSLVDDERIMERARRKAARLLQGTTPEFLSKP